MTVEVFAPAKLNLTLHVTGRRADGYHLIDTLVAFPPVGDRLELEPAETLSLHVTGPEAAGVPAGEENLVLRAARLFAAGQGARITLHKHLPAASGIGGGSSDAAAALRGLAALWSLPLPPAEAILALGADLPMCLAPRPLRVTGIGETLTNAPALPEGAVLLANPRRAVPTADVFAGLQSRDNPAMPPLPESFPDAQALAAFLAPCRNDLEAPAIAREPAIAETLAALRAQAPLLARMSGSGATCFALFETLEGARAAETALRRAQPDWWLAAATLNGGAARAAPYRSRATT